MNIYVNNTLLEIPPNARIQDALETMNLISLSGIAVAINNTVIPKAEWTTYLLSERDKVTLIKATQGG